MTMSRAEVTDVYERHLAAERAHDHDAAAATYLDRGYYEFTPLGLRLEGRGAVAMNYALAYAAMPDVDFEIEVELIDGERLVHWGEMVGTVTGEYLGQPPTGRSVRLPFIAAFEFAEGMMLGERLWFDLATLCSQAGLDLDVAVRWAGETASLLQDSTTLEPEGSGKE
jgi:predicted ester cyclase